MRRRSEIIKIIMNDIVKCRATSVMIIGVLAFGLLITYHSTKIFGHNTAKSRGRTAQSNTMHTALQDEMVDMERAMTAILTNHKGECFTQRYVLRISDLCSIQGCLKLPSLQKKKFNYSIDSMRPIKHLQYL